MYLRLGHCVDDVWTVGVAAAERTESAVSSCRISTTMTSYTDEHHPHSTGTGTGTGDSGGSGTAGGSTGTGTTGSTVLGGTVELKNARSTVSVTKSDSELLRQSPTFDDADQPAVYVTMSSSLHY